MNLKFILIAFSVFIALLFGVIAYKNHEINILKSELEDLRKKSLLCATNSEILGANLNECNALIALQNSKIKTLNTKPDLDQIAQTAKANFKSINTNLGALKSCESELKIYKGLLYELSK